RPRDPADPLLAQRRLGLRRGARASRDDARAVTPRLSIVVASVNGLPYLEACLEALERHAPDCELIVADATDAETRALVTRRWPAVKLLSFDVPMTVPELRAAG